MAGDLDCSSTASAQVELDASGSLDPDSSGGATDIVSFKWFADFHFPTAFQSIPPARTLLGTGSRLTVSLQPGSTPITLRVTDSKGETDLADVEVAIPDDDNDGVCGGIDNCPSVRNRDQADGDGDGFGDACDNCPLRASADQSDPDGDRLGTPCDNCPSASNYAQEDYDGDGAGDACDADDDGDAVEDHEDNCPRQANPTQSDRDGDGAGNACDFGFSAALAVGGGLFLSIESADFDEDGVDDLLLGGDLFQEQPPAVRLGRGDGTFGEPLSPCGDMSVVANSAVVGDLDRDGHLDVVLNSLLVEEGILCLGRGDGAFHPGVRLPTPIVPGVFGMGDFNADGRLDLTLANSSDESIGVLLGNGDGTFVNPALADAGRGSTALAVGDFNGDRYDDIAAVGFDESVRVLLSGGDGTFGAPVTHPTGTAALAIAAADVNLDGNLDLVTAGGGVSVLLGAGDGGFQPLAPALGLSVGDLPEPLAVADLNSDGAPDLLARSGQPTPMLLGNGDGTFSLPPPSFVTFSPYDFAAADLNLDRRIDVVVSRSAGVFVYLNQGAFPPEPPVARAQAPGSVACTSASGGEVILDGSASTDPDSTPGTHDDIVAFEWLAAFGTPAQHLLGSGETLRALLPLGDHDVTLRVTDSAGNTGTDTVAVRVLDDAPPTLSVSADPAVLWPPNHRLVPVHVSLAAADLCDPSPRVRLVSVTSSEPDDAPGAGDGHTRDDIRDAGAGDADADLVLRAERSGAGSGRTYVLSYAAADASGRESFSTATVFVPHSQDGLSEPMVLSAEATEAGTRLSWGAVPGASHYNLVRGSVHNLSELEEAISLGPVRCVERQSADTSTIGFEDGEVPAPGTAFFYAGEYGPSPLSSYGTEPAAKPRTASRGGCQ